MKPFYFPAREEICLANVFYALSEPTRLKIVKMIAAQGEQSCAGFALPVPKSTLSHHFKVLRETGLIYSRAEGTQYINCLRRADLDARFPGLLDAVLCALEVQGDLTRGDETPQP